MARSTRKADGATPPARKPAAKPPKLPSIVLVAQRLGRMIPEEERRRIPKDLSSQVDHYVYGLPKR
jgi:hypothetical protein